MLDRPSATFESRDIYLVRCPSFGAHDEWPSVPYFRLVVIADYEQATPAELKKLAKHAVARGAYSTLAAGTAAEAVETAFDQAIIDGKYEVAGRTYLTAIERSEEMAEALWNAFYTMLGDPDIEEDTPPLVVLIKEGDPRAAEVEDILSDPAAVFRKILDKDES